MGGINSPLAQNNQDLFKNPLEDTQKEIDDLLAQGKKITGQIDNLRVVPEEQKKLQDDLKTVDTQKQQAEKVVIVETQQELSAHIADLNNDRFVGTEVKNDNRYNKLRAKQEIADQDQKDLMNAIGRIQDLGTRDKNILLGFLDKGTLQGVNFTRGLAANYAEMMFGQNPTKEEKKQALDWAKQIKGLLQRDNLWDDAKKVNRLEKKQDRLEKRAQNKTEYNEKETIFTEKELLAMFQSTAKMMGQDAFAKALHDKLATLSGSGGLLNWQNMQGLNESLSNPGQAQLIRKLIMQALPYMTVVSLRDFLEPKKSTIDKVDDAGKMYTVVEGDTAYTIAKKHGIIIPSLYKWNDLEDFTSLNVGMKLRVTPPSTTDKQEQFKKEIEVKYASAIDQKTADAIAALGLDPQETQDAQRALRSQVAWNIAAGYADVQDPNTGTNITGAGLGTGVTINNLSPLIDRMTIGVGVSDKGAPGFAINFGKDIALSRTTTLTGNAGSANVLIPFARIGIDQSLNMGALKKNLEAKRLWNTGVYAEATIGYAGVGIELGNDLSAGIDAQSDNIDKQLNAQLSNIKPGSTPEQVATQLKQLFSKADDASLLAMARHILDGMKQGFTWEDISGTFAAAWKNEALKQSKGKVDFSMKAGVGTLATIPVINAFVGMKIYKKATMRTDKFDRQAKEQRLSSFAGFEKFDNADVQNMSYAEKIAYWLGDNAEVAETDTLITIRQKGNATNPIYDQFDIFIKDKSLVKVTDNAITLSKGSNLLMGTLIGAQDEKQKLYIGYDSENDMAKAKRAINSPINGEPNSVSYLSSREVRTLKTAQEFMSVDLGLDTQDVSAIDTMIKGNRQKFIDMTDPKKTPVATKEKYNKIFGEFAEATKGTDDELLKQTIVGLNGYLKIFDANFDALWAKEQNKRYITNVLLETGSTSAKVNAIAEGKTVGGVNSIGQMLAKRQGHVDAFKNSGIPITEKSFANLYEKAKKIDGKTEKYETENIPQAIALVSYYRRGLKPTTGFVSGDLEIVKGEEYRETATEIDAKAKLEESFQTTREFSLLLDKVNAFMKDKKPDVQPLNADQLMDLVKNQSFETADGVKITLPSEFVKMLYAPCANEGFMISFGQLSMKYTEITTKVEKTPGDVYVGMEYTENYQTANSINIGAGVLAGRNPQAPTPPPVVPPEEPPVEPPKPKGGTIIEDGGNNQPIIGTSNGTGTGGDDGEGGGGR